MNSKSAPEDKNSSAQKRGKAAKPAAPKPAPVIQNVQGQDNNTFKAEVTTSVSDILGWPVF